MINVTQNFLNAITSNVRFREMKKIEVSDTEDFATSFFIENEVIEVKSTLQGRLFNTNMTQLNVELIGEYDLQGKFFKYHRGVVPYDDITQEYWCDYGIFRVNTNEYEDDTNRTKILAHDLMLKSMQVYKPNDMNLTYPLTVKTLYERLLTVIGLERYEVNNFPNQNYIINKDVYINRDVTYREVLDEISNLAGSTISIKDNKAHLYQFEETGLTLSQNLAQSLEVGEKIGKFNILNLAREPQNDNYPYPLDFDTIPEKERIEFIFSNNELINNDRETLAPLIFPLINNFDYYTFNHNAQGYGIFNVGDIVTVEDQKGVKYNSIVTDQVSTFKGMMLSETESKVISNLKPEYSKPNQLQKLGREMYFIVDQQNGVIEGLINEVSEVKDETSRLTIEVDKIQTEVSQIHLGNIIPNLNMYDFDMTGWLGNGLALYTLDAKFYNGLTYGATAYPIRVPEAMSDFGLSFFHSGELFSPFGYKVPRETFSWRGRVKNFAPFSITVYEYKSMTESSYKNTIFNFNLPQLVNELTLNLDNDTKYVKIGIKIASASPSNRVIFYDMMFNAGVPRDWYESAQDVMIYAQSTRTQLSDRITDNVTALDKLSGDIHNTTVDITASEGVVIYNNNGKGLTVLNDSGEKVIELDSAGNVISRQMISENAIVNGKITTNDLTATGGEIGGYTITGNDLVGNDVRLGINTITINDVILRRDGTTTNAMNIEGAGINIKGTSGVIPHINMNDKGFVLGLASGNSLREIININAPVSTTNGSIGQADGRYGNIFLRNQPNVSSDAKLKSNFTKIDPLLIKLIGQEVYPMQYNVANDDKLHFGYLAQHVETALYKYYVQTKGQEYAQDMISNVALLGKHDRNLSLLYGELAVIMDAYNRSRIDKLEERLLKLEELLQKEEE